MRTTATFLAALMCSACVTASRLDGPPGPSPAATPMGFSRTVRIDAMDRRFVETNAEASMQRVAAAATDGHIDILALSGGGAGGAYGAGLLVGLNDAGQRPQYEIVTGVSTGALIAPLAFLGPDWDDELTEAYANGASSDLMHPFGAMMLFHTALFNGKPLRDLVDRFITDDLMAAVARESAKGRLLLVATTNLDREGMVIWNLGAIAEQGGPHARALFRDVLVASASVPGVFPPVLIEVQDGDRRFQEMHVDGGASTPFFIAPDISLALGDAPPQLHGANVFVVSNSQLSGYSHTTRFNTVSIANRSFSAVMNHMTRAALAQSGAFADRNQMRFRFTTIPRDYPYGGSLAFNQREMSALFHYGRRCAAEGHVWLDTSQALERIDNIAHDQSTDDAPCPAPETAPQR